MSQIYGAECVLPGHPDKLSDAIADAIVDAAGRRERRALVGVEVAVHRASVFVTGRIAGAGANDLDVASIVRDVYASAGYDAAWQPAPADLRVETELCRGPLDPGEDEFRGVADDQSIVTGYAVDSPGTNDLPIEHWLAHRVARRLAEMRCAAPALRLGPDGKTAVVVAEEPDGRWRCIGLTVSLQQHPDGPPVELHRAVLAAARDVLAETARAVPGLDPAPPADVAVNGAGAFAVGGPEGDNGLSGKKLVVDAYGPRVPIGGGALSGKDFHKADRAGALLARRIARAVVRVGGRRWCLATVGFFPGDRAARVLRLESDAGPLDTERWAPLFDRSLAGIGDRYTGVVDLVRVARWGHFTDPTLPWERIAFAN